MRWLQPPKGIFASLWNSLFKSFYVLWLDFWCPEFVGIEVTRRATLPFWTVFSEAAWMLDPRYFHLVYFKMRGHKCKTLNFNSIADIVFQFRLAYLFSILFDWEELCFSHEINVWFKRNVVGKQRVLKGTNTSLTMLVTVCFLNVA